MEIPEIKENATKDLLEKREVHKKQLLVKQEERLMKQPIKELPFKIGEFVSIRIEASDRKRGKKLTPKFKGRYVILEVHDSTARLINTVDQTETTVNYDRMKRIPKGNLKEKDYKDSESEETKEEKKLLSQMFRAKSPEH